MVSKWNWTNHFTSLTALRWYCMVINFSACRLNFLIALVFSVFPKESIAYIRTRSRDASFHKHTDHLTNLPGNIFMAVFSSVHKRLSKFYHCSCSEAIWDYATCVRSRTFTRLCHQHSHRCFLPVTYGGRYISMKATTVFLQGGQCGGSFFSHSMTKMSSWRMFCDKKQTCHLCCENKEWEVFVLSCSGTFSFLHVQKFCFVCFVVINYITLERTKCWMFAKRNLALLCGCDMSSNAQVLFFFTS